jgi:hypothetical protein
MKRYLLPALLLASAVVASAQPINQIARKTASAAALPATCASTTAVKDMIWQNTVGWNVCTAPNTWTAVGTATGTVTSVGLVGTANQITVTGASPITTSGSWTLSFPAGGVTLPGTTNGTFAGVALASRLINTTSPLTGGGDLSADRTFACATCLVTGGALGTPSSGTGTNLTGIPESALSLTDITTNNVSITKHGLAPKGDNVATHFLDGTGAYTTPAGGSPPFADNATSALVKGTADATKLLGISVSGVTTGNRPVLSIGGTTTTPTFGIVAAGTFAFGTNTYGYTNGTGPVICDGGGGSGFCITDDLSGLSTNRTQVRPNAAGTIVLDTAAQTMSNKTFIAPILGTPASGVMTNVSGTAASLTAGNATNTAITDDTTTNATMDLTWVTTNTGNLPQKVSSTKLTFNPSTGVLTPSGGLTGTATNDDACAGCVGAVLSGDLPSGSKISLTTATPANITSVSLTAGDWQCYGNATYNYGAGTSVTVFLYNFSTTSATLDLTNGHYGAFASTGLIAGSTDPVFVVPTLRVKLSGTTTLYLVTQASFTVSTLAAYGHFDCRRMR